MKLHEVLLGASWNDLYPTHRGSFNIWDNEDDILEEVMAHMSISACHKVYDEARQFKPVMHLEKLPRSHVWPKSFEQSESGAGNIALFFFPSERLEMEIILFCS